jgi:hypothetical protein
MKFAAPLVAIVGHALKIRKLKTLKYAVFCESLNEAHEKLSKILFLWFFYENMNLENSRRRYI